MASKFLSLDQKCSKLSSAHCSIPGSNPEQWLWEGSTCVQTLGNMDRNRQRDPNNSCFFPLHATLGRTNNPCSSSQLLAFWEGDAGRECQPQVSLDFFHPAFSAQHMASQHPSPPLLSRAHLHLPKLHTRSAGVQVHS